MKTQKSTLKFGKIIVNTTIDPNDKTVCITFYEKTSDGTNLLNEYVFTFAGKLH